MEANEMHKAIDSISVPKFTPYGSWRLLCYFVLKAFLLYSSIYYPAVLVLYIVIDLTFSRWLSVVADERETYALEVTGLYNNIVQRYNTTLTSPDFIPMSEELELLRAEKQNLISSLKKEQEELLKNMEDAVSKKNELEMVCVQKEEEMKEYDEIKKYREEAFELRQKDIETEKSRLKEVAEKLSKRNEEVNKKDREMDKTIEEKANQKAQVLAERLSVELAKEMAVELAEPMAQKLASEKLDHILNAGKDSSKKYYDSLDSIEEKREMDELRKLKEEVEHEKKKVELNAFVQQAKDILAGAREEKFSTKEALLNLEKMLNEKASQLEKQDELLKKEFEIGKKDAEITSLSIKTLILELEHRIDRQLTEKEAQRVRERFEDQLSRIHDKQELKDTVTKLANEVEKEFIKVEKEFVKVYARMDIFESSVQQRFAECDSRIKELAGEIKNVKLDLLDAIRQHKHWTNEQLMQANNNVHMVVDGLEKFHNKFGEFDNKINQTIIQAQQENWGTKRLNAETHDLLSNFNREKEIAKREMDAHLSQVAGLNEQASSKLLNLYHDMSDKARDIEWKLKELGAEEQGKEQSHRLRLAELNYVERDIKHKEEQLKSTRQLLDERIEWKEKQAELVRKIGETEDNYRMRLMEARRKHIIEEIQHDEHARQASYRELQLQEELYRANNYKQFMTSKNWGHLLYDWKSAICAWVFSTLNSQKFTPKFTPKKKGAPEWQLPLSIFIKNSWKSAT